MRTGVGIRFSSRNNRGELEGYGAVKKEFVDFFTRMFSAQQSFPANCKQRLESVMKRKLNSNQQALLEATVTEEEIKAAMAHVESKW